MEVSRDLDVIIAILKVTDDILAAWNRGLLTSLVLLDSTKAFDRIKHNLSPANPHNIGRNDYVVKLKKLC